MILPQRRSRLLTPLFIKKLSPRELRHYKIGAYLSYIPAYLYIVNIFSDNPSHLILAALAAVALTEWNLAHFDFQNNFKEKKLEDILLLLSVLAQLLAIGLWGLPEELAILQLLGLHITFIYYVLSRNNLLIQGRFGVLSFIDAFRGFWTIPFGHFRFRSRMRKIKMATEDTKPTIDPGVLVTVLVSLIVASILGSFAISQLQVVSENFKDVTQGIAHFLGSLFSNLTWLDYLCDLFIYGPLSLPLGAYLYGLIIAPVIHQKASKADYASIQGKLSNYRVLPYYSTYIIIGSLCLIYSLFLVTSIFDLQSLLQLNHISPQDASSTAVAGFWQLVRIALLNFTILALCYFFSSVFIWDKKIGKIFLTLLFAYTLAFALLAAWKLFGIYINLYGLTPLRLISGWFITVLIFWTCLTLARLCKSFDSVRLAIFYTLISFSCLPYLFGIFIN
ncbi:hypothetical protein A9Q68_09025 [Streptococcus bovimastitidis]|uniref:Uncharacterized protein n=1 Tax=Streptococcus bovimastitidis TaxID=1856638 RepID=A0A1L8MKR8_9STRE|nr:DUF4153 domain-containing protein [Streptococcus bovimastitidis]OJF71328.1 hypothetical protein A9Q68_09025 [Streptococcus bovimastitidis]